MDIPQLLKAIATKTMELVLNMEIEEVETEDIFSFDQEQTDILNSFAM